MKIPSKVRRGEQPKADTVNDIIDCLRSMRLGNSQTIRVSANANGTVLEVDSRGLPRKKTELHPFQLYRQAADLNSPSPDEDWRTFFVHTGKISCMAPDNDDAGDSPEAIIVPASTEKYYVWIEAKFQVKGVLAPVVQEVTIKHGADPAAEGWPDYPNQSPGEEPYEDGLYVRQVVGVITTGTDDDHNYTIDQNVRSHLTFQMPIDRIQWQRINGVLQPKKTWKKMIVFGPDNYVDCPEPTLFSSSSQSSSKSSSQQTSGGSQTSGGGGDSEPLVNTTPDFWEGTEGTPFYQECSAIGGSPPYTFELFGDLPSGLIFGGNTVIGTPAQGTAGDYYLVSRVTDQHGEHADVDVLLTIYDDGTSGGTTSGQSSSNPYSDFSLVGSESKTAIVPVRRNGRVEWRGLHCAEMPDARFEDILVVKLGRRRIARRKLDPIFVQVCEPGSILVTATPSHPVAVGARIEGRDLIVERAPLGIRNQKSEIRNLVVTIRLSAIRRGFAGRRFQKFTRAQALANARFYAQAHQPQQPVVIEEKIVTGARIR